MRHDIVFLDRSTLKAKLRRPAFEHCWAQYDVTAPHDVVRRLEGATIAITNKVPLRAETLAQLPRLAMIAVAATGYDVIDTAYCRAHGIAVANIRNYATHTVPEHTFALILALRRNLLAYGNDVRRGRWQASNQFCFFDHPIRDLHGATLGIVGDGALGRGTAAIARGFGMRVLFAEHASTKDKPRDVAFVPLDQLLREADIVSLHTPLRPETRNLIGLDQIKTMKRSALLINTARGGLVCEASLATALREGLIAGAGFDVLSTEPPKAGNPLLELDLPNFILTPHVAWASDGAMQFLADQLIDNVEAYVSGEPQHLVA
ncbi:D-2-hydroxyacid dehydrogenase [Paraburkholderia sp. EG287B]|uniref:D-2-hydroxyacid dehydrogenase n=1 Tax=Paraburkholderia sp. EG287B TaxID=3237010 RepID=UPI0034D36693